MRQINGVFRYAREALINTMGLIMYLGADWLIVVLMPKMYGFEYTGVFSYSYSVTSISYTIACFSIRNFHVVSGYKDYTEDKYYSSQLMSTILSMALSIFYFILRSHTLEEILTLSFLLFSQSVAAYCTVFFASLQIRGRIDLVGFNGVLVGPIKLSLFVIFFFVGFNPIVNIGLMSVISSIVYLGYCYFQYIRVVGGRPPISIKMGEMGWKILFLCFPVMIGSLIPTVLNAMPKIAMQRYLESKEVGYYATLSAISTLIPSFANSIFAPLLVRLSSLFSQKNYKKFREYIILYPVGGILIICFSIYLLSDLFTYFFRTFYGEEIVKNMRVFYYSIFAMIGLSLVNYYIPILMIFCRNKAIMYFSLVACAVGGGTIGFLTKKEGMVGASVGLMLSYILFAVFLSLYSVYVLKYIEGVNEEK